jgi:peptidoglycan glycosyltransferase
MALVGAAIANDGVMMEPRVVSAIREEDGDVVDRTSPDEWRRVIDEVTAESMHELMLASADYGYASAAKIEGLTVGGKTGTAETGDGQQPHAWFVGYAQDGERTLVTAVIVEHGGSGGATALPIGRDLLASAFSE